VSTDQKISTPANDAAPGMRADTTVNSQLIEQKFDFWRMSHRALRGRYRMAVLLAAVGAVAGMSVGSQLGQRLYTSVGLVRIASVLPQVMGETDQNRPMAMFDGFIQAQREIITSRDMIQAAVDEETWKRVKDTGHAPSDEQFASKLKVETRPRSDHLKITFTNKDPAVASAAVQSIIAAYQRTYVFEQDRVEQQRVDELKVRRESLAAELQELDAVVGADKKDQTAADLEPLYVAAADRAKKLRAALSDVQCAIAGVPDLNQRPAAPEKLPYEIVADELLRSYVVAQVRAENELASIRSIGYGETHPKIVQLKAAAEASQQRVDDYVRQYEVLRSNRASGPSPVSLTERETNLKKLVDATEKEMKQIAARRALLKIYEEQSATIQQNLKATDARLDELATEATFGSRFKVIRNGDLPMTASKDNRVKVAAAGALAGLAAPLGCMILLDRLRRRYRYCDEIAEDLQARVPFVAVLPDVSNGGKLGSAASRCIHDLRMRLQPRKPGDSRVYLITSTSSGEGTTSLTLSIALSCVASNLRTLVIDCNLASRRLTLEFDAGSSAGMLEALTDAKPVVRQAGAGLSFLPTGQIRSEDAFNVAPAALTRLLDNLRSRFDVILIDGEPILSGVTSSAIAQQADGVVVTLARGQEPSLVECAIKKTEIIGAVLAGVIFNRAVDSDFPSTMREQVPALDTAKKELSARLTRFGPLVGQMMMSLSLSRETDLDLIPLASKSSTRADSVPKAA